jgi:kynurenine 3-monooxygenase
MVRCDRLHVGDRIGMIGDAAHAVSPSIGQGCNAALQDVQVLMSLLDQYDDDWSQALPAFTARRLPDVHALRELSDYSFPRSKRLMLEFIFRVTLGKQLARWFPQWGNPLPMELVTEGDLSYSEVLAQTQGWIERVKRSHL